MNKNCFNSYLLLKPIFGCLKVQFEIGRFFTVQTVSTDNFLRMLGEGTCQKKCKLGEDNFGTMLSNQLTHQGPAKTTLHTINSFCL